MIASSNVALASAPAGCEAWQGRRVHMIGIGGCGMRAAAAVMQHWGARITGSDLSSFPEAGRLVAGGAKLHVGHAAEHVPPKVDLIVVSAAVPPDNPELVQARKQETEVLTYAELVGRLISLRLGVAVAGTHGKSTTSALTAFTYRMAGLDPCFIVGANSRQLGGSGGVGDGAHFIIESCEYARSFLHQRPHLAAILNIERDHLDCYRDLNDIVDAFARFASNVQPDGVIIARHEELPVRAAVCQANTPLETFGFEPEADWRATDVLLRDGFYSFTVCFRGEPLFATGIRLAGAHNVLNALAATALALHGGAQIEAVDEALRTFDGVDRRMSVRRNRSGVTVIDDYAHHPTEIAATLRAIRDRYHQRRTWVVFQPHQYSRTRLLMNEFATCFADADTVLIPDIYAARDSEEERRMTGARDLVCRLQDNGSQARYLPTLEDVTAHLAGELSAGDVVVTMGAGDVWKVADALVG